MRAAWAPNSSYDYVQSVPCNMYSGYEGGWTLAHEPTTKTQPVSSLSEVSSNCKCGHEYSYGEIFCHRCGTKRSDGSITKTPQPLPPMPTSGDTKALSWSRPSLCVNEINEDGGRTFAFTLRKANNVELGLDVSYVSGGKCLTVGGITSCGAIAAWNKQWVGVTAGSKAIKLGDDIVYVNGYTDAESMLNQCTEQSILKVKVRRAIGGAIWYV